MRAARQSQILDRAASHLLHASERERFRTWAPVSASARARAVRLSQFPSHPVAARFLTTSSHLQQNLNQLALARIRN